ncbi:hypothetical protein EG327_010199 [Venturia inaequalis]|uniref:Uncharacterized protein n=1 Tax=Venturia inaequalis TaxID=5025 RepID=A0A8H3VQR8_VENIN|nr:hypothetical protein EG327_010199 [Venturia inaequalis]
MLPFFLVALSALVFGPDSALARNNAAFSAQMYQSGAVMEKIMSTKMKFWTELQEAGRFNSSMYPQIDEFVSCENGYVTAVPGDASSTFRCNNVDLYHFRSHESLGSKQGQGSSSWGWTSPEGREFVALGQADGAAFIEINKKGKMLYLGRLPQYSTPGIWREIRGYKDYMIIGSESAKHNIQIFDMKKLLELDEKNPVTFSNEKDLTGLFKGLPDGRTHNVVVNEGSGFVYAVGAVPRTDVCKSGLIAIDMADPSKPTSPGCASEGGYVHDAQCIMYKGPDAKYQNREICYGFNENMMVIYDMTDKKAPTIISSSKYDGSVYCHQGWVLDPNNQEYLLMDDEYDEYSRYGLAKDGHPVTYIWNIMSLEKPFLTGHFKSPVRSIDHNQYIHNGLTFQSNYGSGLRVLNISSIPRDPTGKGVKEVGYFDIYPEDDQMTEGGSTKFVGSWSSYAGFKSG